MKQTLVLLQTAPLLLSNGNRPLQMTFEDQFNILVYFHLEEHDSGRDLLQALGDNEFARQMVAPQGGIGKSSFFEALGTRGVEQLLHVYNGLLAEASQVLPPAHAHLYPAHAHLGDLQAIDGSLIDAALPMTWAEYCSSSNKARVHLGFDINRGIPSRNFLPESKADERPYVSEFLQPGQTGVMDRYDQRHRDFDAWQAEGKHFVCRIRANTRRPVVEMHSVPADSPVIFDELCLLGTKGQNPTEQPVRVVGYRRAQQAVLEPKAVPLARDPRELLVKFAGDREEQNAEELSRPVRVLAGQGGLVGQIRNTQMDEFADRRAESIAHIEEALGLGELAIDHGDEVFPRRKVPGVPVGAVPARHFEKGRVTHECEDLTEKINGTHHRQALLSGGWGCGDHRHNQDRHNQDGGHFSGNRFPGSPTLRFSTFGRTPRLPGRKVLGHEWFRGGRF